MCRSETLHTYSLLAWGSQAEESRAVSLPKIGRYDDLGILGVGGMGEVLLAKERVPSREVALKRALRKEKAYMNALRHEAMIMGSLEHPNIIPVHRVMNSSEHGPQTN